MNPMVEKQLAHVLKHLYINPLEQCNLRCAICYTRKTSPILSEEEIMNFISRYRNVYPLETVTFCGGEVFTLPYFPHVLNELTKTNIFVQIITNGTVDRLDRIDNPNQINLIVSLDGLAEYHDKNRGEGNFEKSLQFMEKAASLRFHLSVFTIVTRQNLLSLDALEHYLTTRLGIEIPVSYHPRKPPSYLMHHPVSNIVGEVDGFDFLTSDEMRTLLQTRNTFPPKELGCYQLALTSNGRVYGCCEGVAPLGTIHDDIDFLGNELRNRLVLWEKKYSHANCLGCSSPEFVCGLQPYLSYL